MKSQSNLEVPKPDSFDEILKRQDRTFSFSTCFPARSHSIRGRNGSLTLKVPQLTRQRSKSFDAYSFPSQQFPPGGIEQPETSIIQVSGCYHCACVEEYQNFWLIEYISKEESDASETDSTDPSENESDRENEERTEKNQEALTTFPLEHLPALVSVATASEADDDDDDEENETVEPCRSKFVVRDIFLTVPELKRDRAASVDSCFNNNKNGGVVDADSLTVPQQSIRSKSVDIVLPTDARTRYTALLPGKESRPPIGWVRLIGWSRETLECSPVPKHTMQRDLELR